MPVRGPPRRRISPRAKQRYRTIRNFLRKAIGSSSQPEIKINSSLVLNASNIKDKIVDIEEQLSEVNKNCHECADIVSGIESTHSLKNNMEDAYQVWNQGQTASDVQLETKVLCNTTEQQCARSDDSVRRLNATQELQTKTHEQMKPTKKTKKYKNSNNTQETTKCKVYTLPVASNSRSLLNINHTTKIAKNHRASGDYKETKQKMKRNKSESPYRRNYDTEKYKTTIVRNSRVDYDFIENIIRKQYRPIKAFGRKESDFSQLSAPVCRDKEFPLRLDLQEGCDLCSCGNIEQPKSLTCRHGYTRFQNNYAIHHSNQTDHNFQTGNYNDENLYDLIPVKEQSSPKSRTKFVDDRVFTYNGHKEVPPSPLSHRPRLNLKVQNYDNFECHQLGRHEKKNYSVKQKKPIQLSTICKDGVSSAYETDFNETNQNIKNMINPKIYKEQTNVNFPNIPAETITNNPSEDQTDKALCEIKDILQNFLIEIKKDSSQSEPIKCNEHTSLGNNDNFSKISNKENNMNNTENHIFPQNNVYPTYLPRFESPCCLPVFPICPISCIHQNCIMPIHSSCKQCTSSQANCTCNQPQCSKKVINNTNEKSIESDHLNETDVMIKEIYKYVSHRPLSNEKDYTETTTKEDKDVLTSRSIYDSSKVNRDNEIKVDRLSLHSLTRSCEVLGSKTENLYKANVCCSDSVLEKFSLGAIDSVISISETDLNDAYDLKRNRRSLKELFLGLFKKRSKETPLDMFTNRCNEIYKNKKRQEPQSYFLPDQNFCQAPLEPSPKLPRASRHPSPPHTMPHRTISHHFPPPHPASVSPLSYEIPPYSYGYPPPPDYNPNFCYPGPIPQPFINDPYKANKIYHNTTSLHDQVGHFLPKEYINNCNNLHSNQMPPPLCIKEIEVKSIATQSDKKCKFFQLFKNKKKSISQPEPMVVNARMSRSCQTVENRMPEPPLCRFSWKGLQQARAQRLGEIDADPMTFTRKTQNDLAYNDAKIKKAMLNKLFGNKKNNPFSSKNLLLKTLVGKDKPSLFGAGPKLLKPKMFM